MAPKRNKLLLLTAYTGQIENDEMFNHKEKPFNKELAHKVIKTLPPTKQAEIELVEKATFDFQDKDNLETLLKASLIDAPKSNYYPDTKKKQRKF